MYYFIFLSHLLMPLIFVTGNISKMQEASKVLKCELSQSNINLPELQSLDVEEVCIDKVKRAYEITKAPVIVEDTGLYIHKLNGFPGALIKFYEKLGLEEISTRNNGLTAYAKSSIAYYDGDNLEVFSGILEGVISGTVKYGKYGFGWDAIFIPNECNGKSFAEITTDDKIEISQRTIALKKLNDYLEL